MPYVFTSNLSPPPLTPSPPDPNPNPTTLTPQFHRRTASLARSAECTSCATKSGSLSRRLRSSCPTPWHSTGGTALAWARWWLAGTRRGPSSTTWTTKGLDFTGTCSRRGRGRLTLTVSSTSEFDSRILRASRKRN